MSTNNIDINNSDSSKIFMSKCAFCNEDVELDNQEINQKQFSCPKCGNASGLVSDSTTNSVVNGQTEVTIQSKRMDISISGQLNNQPLDKPRNLTRVSLWLMVALTIVSAGLWLPFWFLIHRTSFNNLSGKGSDKMSYTFFVFLTILFAYSISRGHDLATTISMWNRLAALLILYPAFKMRRVFSAMFPDISFSRIYTLFVSIFYLQHKINKDLSSRDPRPTLSKQFKDSYGFVALGCGVVLMILMPNVSGISKEAFSNAKAASPYVLENISASEIKIHKSNVTESANRLYSKIFSSEGRVISISDLKPFLTNDLFLLFEKDSKCQDEESKLSFDPFQDAQDIFDTFQVTNVDVSVGGIATVSILLSGMGGNMDASTALALEFHKQNNQPWLINNIHYDGKTDLRTIFLTLQRLASNTVAPPQSPFETSVSNANNQRQPIDLVKASRPRPLDSTPYTLEYTFESFCDNNNWRHFTSKSGQDIVEYSGSVKEEHLKSGEEISICVQYQYDPKLEAPKVVYFELNGEKQPPEIFPQFLLTAAGAAMQRAAREAIPDKVE